MKPETIRVIDVLAGKPICFFLTVIRRAARSLGWRQQAAKGPVKKILILKLIEQGATVIAYGALCRAGEMVGRQNVFFLVFADNQEIVQILDTIPRENVLSLRSRNIFVFLADVLKALRTIRKLRIDAVVDMEFFSRASAILSFLTGARRRVGLHRFTSEAPYRGDLFTHRIQYNPYVHTSQAYWLLVEALTMDETQRPLPKYPLLPWENAAPRFVPGREEQETMKSILRQAAGRELRGPLILLNPNASDMLPLRKWPLDRFVALGKELLGLYPEAHIAITGAPSEQEAGRDICRQIASPRAFSLAGETTLHQLLTLYTLADILITNDSGPAHFASLTQIESIILFGPETPSLFGPVHGRFHAISAKLACSPCVNVFNHRFSPCRDNICMQMITVQEVFEAVRVRLAAKVSDKPMMRS